MLSKHISVFIALIILSAQTSAQECNLSISGHVYDEGSEGSLSYVNVYVQEDGQGTTTDETGIFLLSQLCRGEYHLIISHIGCEPLKIHLDLDRDTTINIGLNHTSTTLSDVVIKGKQDDRGNQPNLSVNRQAIEDNTNQNLSSLLENETGVSLLKNGSGISKPVVHGLYGNRLSILNNGIIQSGQQWGNDHSPEIDPFAADKIVVIKGASALEYGGNLGSVILVEPTRLIREPHLHGQVNYNFETNGRGHNINTRLEQYNPKLAWRINGTHKRYGDRKSADYFLNNTGLKEASFAIQLEKTWEDRLFLDFYASTFNTDLGILRGSHIGNLTDLEQAFSRAIPFFTEEDYSSAVDAPKQSVSHHLIKAKAKYYIKDRQSIELTLATQINDRKEFDIRRSGRSDIPALSLTQHTFNIETKYSNSLGENWNFNLGNQNIITDNTNNPETGILPLIPDYLSWKSGIYSTLSKELDKIQFNAGVRYDFEYQSVVSFSNTTPREIIRSKNRFNNFSSLLGLKLDLSKSQHLHINLGYAMRNPAINELYSNGLHQGVSGIEEGDINLLTEKALKSTLEYEWFPSTNFSISALLYHQIFYDYIYLNPQNDVRLTIRGAFPVFKYAQTNATISGIDLSSQFTLNDRLIGILKYSFLRGRDRGSDTPLIFMPSNSFFSSLTYRLKKSVTLSRNTRLEDTEIELNNKLVFEQKNILVDQDFAPPPPTYNLLGLKISTQIISTNYKVRCFIKADNIFNIRYRDYLNRQRYFADDLGRSVTAGVSYKF